MIYYKLKFLNGFQNIYMKEEIKQNPTPPNHQTNCRKTTVQREFYVCFCAKSYNSYSALYLHAKKKHDQILTMKCLKFKKHQWSGSVKNIFYEFVEEDFSDSAQVQSQNLKLILPSKKSSKESPKQQNEMITSGSDIKTSQKSAVQEKLLDPFSKYLEEKKNEKDSEIRAGVILQFLNYIATNYQEISNDMRFKGICTQGSPDIVPHVMNSFYITYSPASIYSQQLIIKQLACFSDWLYNLSYCKYLAVERKSYEQFFQNRIQIPKKCS